MVVGGWACGAVAHGAVRSGESGSRLFFVALLERSTEKYSLCKYVDIPVQACTSPVLPQLTTVGEPHPGISEHDACVSAGRLFKAGGLIACDGERARRTRRRWRATAARARERARERRRRGAPRCSGLCAARLWLSAGAAAPGLAVGAGAGGLSRVQKRKAQRNKTLDQAQRDGALDGRSRAGQDRLQRLFQARCIYIERERMSVESD